VCVCIYVCDCVCVRPSFPLSNPLNTTLPPCLPRPPLCPAGLRPHAAQAGRVAPAAGLQRPGRGRQRSQRVGLPARPPAVSHSSGAEQVRPPAVSHSSGAEPQRAPLWLAWAPGAWCVPPRACWCVLALQQALQLCSKHLGTQVISVVVADAAGHTQQASHVLKPHRASCPVAPFSHTHTPLPQHAPHPRHLPHHSYAFTHTHASTQPHPHAHTPTLEHTHSPPPLASQR